MSSPELNLKLHIKELRHSVHDAWQQILLEKDSTQREQLKDRLKACAGEVKEILNLLERGPPHA